MGGGGKCTLLKQMTRLLKGPFSIDERKKAQENILVNLIQGCQVIIGKMDYEKVEFDTPESEVSPTDQATRTRLKIALCSTPRGS